MWLGKALQPPMNPLPGNLHHGLSLLEAPTHPHTEGSRMMGGNRTAQWNLLPQLLSSEWYYTPCYIRMIEYPWSPVSISCMMNNKWNKQIKTNLSFLGNKDFRKASKEGWLSVLLTAYWIGEYLPALVQSFHKAQDRRSSGNILKLRERYYSYLGYSLEKRGLPFTNSVSIKIQISKRNIITNNAVFSSSQVVTS